jgi:hypothetical protein
MPYSPSPRLERLAERLIPPACAEYVLGDLAESSRSQAEYLRNVISVVPHVVWSQIRRRVTVIGLIFHAAITAGLLSAFLKTAFVPGGPTVLLRAAVPWAIWIIGSALAAAYGHRDRRAQSNRMVLVATMVTAVLAAAATGLPAVRVAMAFGAVFGRSPSCRGRGFRSRHRSRPRHLPITRGCSRSVSGGGTWWSRSLVSWFSSPTRAKCGTHRATCRGSHLCC